MSTIVQNYGPIYGEVVNGTVQGRPNGSVYVPISNTINATVPDDCTMSYGGTYPNRVYLSAIEVNAIAQDLASNVRLTIYKDAELTQEFLVNNWTAGTFNISARNARIGSRNEDDPIEDEKTYYGIVQLMNNNTPVATSTAVIITGVNPA